MEDVRDKGKFFYLTIYVKQKDQKMQGGSYV
jgi:hypothetical protein